MKRIIITCLGLILISSAILYAKTVLDFGNPMSRNWTQNEETILITVDADDLNTKLQGADTVWVVLSARYLGPGFWDNYPKFTENCVINKGYDFKWIESMAVSPEKVTSNQFRVTNTYNAYYGFILVEKGDTLQAVTPEKIGSKKKYKMKELLDNPVEVNNPVKLERKWEDDKKEYCE